MHTVSGTEDDSQHSHSSISELASCMSNLAHYSARYFGAASANYDVVLARGAYFCTFKKIPDSCLKGSKVFEFLPH